jgi:fructose/tagatose bisphosphate aldolase
MRGLFDIVDTFDPIVMVPNSRVSYACYLLSKFNEDSRMKNQYKDLVHPGYAMAYNVPVFLTTDTHLTHYRIPQTMMEKGFKQPKMMDLSAIKREYL